jgi:hypothetical protein
MNPINNKLKIQSQQAVEQNNFLGLRNGEVNMISQEAVAKALEKNKRWDYPSPFGMMATPIENIPMDELSISRLKNEWIGQINYHRKLSKFTELS